MATDDRQILVTGTANAPAQFLVPGNGQVRPKAVYATFDGTGAAATFLPILEVFSDAGELIGRWKAESSVAAGASADVSWFPHVAAAAAAAGGSLPWGMASAGNIVLPTGAGFTFVDFNLGLAGTSFGSSGDGTVTLGAVGGGITGLILNVQGVYMVSWHVQGFTAVAPAANSTVEIGSDWDTGDYMAGSSPQGPFIVSAGPTRNWEAGEHQLLDLDPANYPIPNTGRLQIRQNSGGNMTVFVKQTAVLVSTVTDPNIL